MTPTESPDGRLTARREHLMNEISTRPRTKWARNGVIAGALAALVVGGGTVAVASGKLVSRQDNGVVALDWNQAEPWYQGRIVTYDEIEELNKEGKAMGSVHSLELGCHGVIAYFDTEAESEAYGKGALARTKARHARHKADELRGIPAPEDPCAYVEAPLSEMLGPTLTPATP